MNEQLKHRLVGAVVLVGFVVIVLPMVLKPPGSADKSGSASNAAVQGYGGHAAGSTVSGGGSPQQLAERRAVQGGERESGFTGGGPISVGSRVARETQRQSPETNTSAQLAEGAMEAASLKRDAGSAIKKSDGSAQAWVVQLGSFSRRSNALALRDRLQARGYAAFVEPRTWRAGRLTRVYVGPELSKARARNLSRTLTKDIQLKVLVVPYPYP